MYSALFWTDDNYTDIATVTDTTSLGSPEDYANAIKALPEWGTDGSLLNTVLAFDPSWGTSALLQGAGPNSGSTSGVGSPQTNIQSFLFPS